MKKKSYLTATDQFCGAGGSSIGATVAGIEVRLAMNHWRLAIETHNTNFPGVDHDCTDISAVDPRRYPSTDVLITSPECTNHSLAKGIPRRFYKQDLFGNVLIDPEEERSRATMWDVPRFAEYHDYEIIVVENVVEAAKWRLWDAWLQAMRALGYEHEVVYFNSMFAWPTPQSRDRIYTVFWKRGNKKPDLDFRPAAFCSVCRKTVEAIQTWKKRIRWGRYKAQYFYRCPDCDTEVTPFYFAAFNAIDWSIPAQRIGDRKRPLREKTMERIRYGLEKYGRKPLIVTGRYTTGVETRVRNAISDPVPTQPGDASHAVLFPWLVGTDYTGQHRATSTAEHSGTQTGQQTLGIAGFLSKQYSGHPASKNLGLDEPTGAVTTWDHHALISTPFLIKTVRQENALDARPASDPHLTQTTCQDIGLITPAFIAELHGQSSARSIDQPMMCVTAGGGHHALLSADAFLTYFYQSKQASGLSDPARTITTKDRIGLVAALENIEVEDLTFRMLKSHEIGRIMSFLDTYVVLGTERERVKQYGNAVTPPVMEMILKRCVASLS